jgi:hypothetical protein
MKSEHEELARIAAGAAHAALAGWSPQDPDSADRLAGAIGEAVAAALTRHEEIRARITANRMAELTAGDSIDNWQI